MKAYTHISSPRKSASNIQGHKDISKTNRNSISETDREESPIQMEVTQPLTIRQRSSTKLTEISKKQKNCRNKYTLTTVLEENKGQSNEKISKTGDQRPKLTTFT